MYNIVCYVIYAPDVIHDSVGNLSQKRMVYTNCPLFWGGFFTLKVKIIAIHRKAIPCYSKIKQLVVFLIYALNFYCKA